MSCSTCNDSSPLVFNVQSFISSTCGDCADTQCLSSKYVCYQGANLVCSGIETGDTLETVLTKIDEQICSAIGDYSTYQMHCLPAYYGEAIDTEAKFVDAITSYACAIATNLQTFTGVEFPQYQSEVAAQISTIDGPGLTCASASVTSGDSLATILSKYCTKFGAIDTELDLSDVDFGECFTVVGTPSTIHQGFTEILSQICQVKAIAEAGSVTLPTFNNVGSCLAAPLTSTDTLIDTINKIKTRLCLTDLFVSGDVTWGCLDPASTSLQDGIEAIVDKVNVLSLGAITEVTADFVLTATNPSEPCEGLTLGLATPLNQDRLVAASDTDNTPGVLIDKLDAGDGIDIQVNGGNDGVEITSLGKVSADATDNAPLGFLVDKLEGSTVNGITITPIYNPSTKKVTLQLTVDDSLFCAAVNNCVPLDCATYLITPSGTDNIYYRDCTSGNVVALTISGPVSVCAVVGSVNAPNSTIVNTGVCAASTTTTTAIPTSGSLVLLNESSSLSISSVTADGDEFYVMNSGAFPLIPSETITAIGTTSSPVDFVVGAGDGIANIYKNNVFQNQVSIPSTGTYAFGAVTFSTGDDMKIIFMDAP